MYLDFLSYPIHYIHSDRKVNPRRT